MKTCASYCYHKYLNVSDKSFMLQFASSGVNFNFLKSVARKRQ